MEDYVDVLIVGAGPAGLMAASWMSRLGVKTRIVDKRGTQVFNGQADGLQCRTMEIFDAFGLVNRILDHARPFYSLTSWGPDGKGGTERKQEVIDAFSSISRYTQYVLNQGYIESALLDSIKAHSDIEVERGVLPGSLSIDQSKAEDPNAYPITVELRHLEQDEMVPHQTRSHAKNGTVDDGLFRSNIGVDDTQDLIDKNRAHGGKSETIHAKYLIGCEGGHSWTRQQLGYEMKGESTDYVWGVLDIVPITDYPDIQTSGTFQSEHGSMLIIPREHGLVRLYTQLHEVKPDAEGQVDRSQITPKVILKTAQKILDPFKLDYEYCDWWTAYQIGQRVGTGFADPTNHVFLAGDAVHTHSPKAGQGMNVSMQDTFNLGWKVGGVVHGWLPRTVLETYSAERRVVAEQLIDFDHKLSRTFSGTPNNEELKAIYAQNISFMSGFKVHYAPSLLVADNPQAIESAQEPFKISNPAIAKPNAAYRVRIGACFPSFDVWGHADLAPTPLQRQLRPDGRWRLLLFPGDLSEESRLASLNNTAANLQETVFNKYTVAMHTKGSKGKIKHYPLMNALTIHKTPRSSPTTKGVELLDLHPSLFPFDKETGYAYDKVYVDMRSEGFKIGGEAYEGYGIDAEKGAMVVCRPDQYVAYITELEDWQGVKTFFEGCLSEKKSGRGINGVVDGIGGKVAEKAVDGIHVNGINNVSVVNGASGHSTNGV